MFKSGVVVPKMVVRRRTIFPAEVRGTSILLNINICCLNVAFSAEVKMHIIK